METLPIVHDCKTKEELIEQANSVHKAIAEFYKNIPDNLFNGEAIPDGWSVKRNMKHVVSTNVFFAKWIGLPAFILKRFPKPSEKQLNAQTMVVTNRKGITDYGKYNTSRHPHLFLKEKLLKAISASNEKLCRAINKRTEEELDSLPAPFGKMTLRVFILFILKHNVHHTNVVRLRVEQSL